MYATSMPVTLGQAKVSRGHAGYVLAEVCLPGVGDFGVLFKIPGVDGDPYVWPEGSAVPFEEFLEGAGQSTIPTVGRVVILVGADLEKVRAQLLNEECMQGVGQEAYCASDDVLHISLSSLVGA